MFDESKVPVFLFIAAVIVVVSFVAHHLQLVDEANALLHESKHKLTSMEETITLRRIMLASIEKAKAAFDKESVRESELERKKAELETRHRRLEGIINSSVESLRAMVGKVRQEALNTTLGDITLKSGRILRAAKISKFDDSSLTFIHADGVSTVTTDQLDAELVSRYDLGESALLPQALLIQSRFLDPSQSSSTQPVSGDRAAQIASLTARKTTLEHQLETATQHKSKLEKQARDIDQQIKSAETQGAYTFPLRNQRDVIEGNVGMANKDLQRLELEIAKVNAELKRLQTH